METLLPLFLGLALAYIIYSFFFGSSKKRSGRKPIIDSLQSAVYESTESMTEQIKLNRVRTKLEFSEELEELGLTLNEATEKVVKIEAMLNGEAPKSEPTQTTKDN